MLHVGLDLSRKRIDVCLISDQGELIDRFTAIPDRDGLHGLPAGWRCMASRSAGWWSR